MITDGEVNANGGVKDIAAVDISNAKSFVSYCII
jgi:hypothetical protein